MISKVLNNWLQGVIDRLIDQNQFVFAPDRLIHDNIMLSKELVKGYWRKKISYGCIIKV